MTSGEDRDNAASERDRLADVNDEKSEARDRRSDARDERATVREASGGRHATVDAAWDRTEAALDRQGSARDRAHSGEDREAASTDRQSAAGERMLAVLDGLTGALHREPGLVALDREVVRAARTGRSFVLAFLDVDGLKAVNDASGHAAGDQVLQQVADAVRARVREYDLLVRHGGDEFLCGLADLPLADAEARLLAAAASSAAGSGPTFSVGLAQLAAGESLDELIGRADAAMYARRREARG